MKTLITAMLLGTAGWLQAADSSTTIYTAFDPGCLSFD
jgi:hypothetical protein